ncbi:hypothetical protein J2X31_000927 [Flavobacterium arsenatis]|uniref:HNH endonuclease n=1 Tax=Flavobacterium arsenatis TaxID=1484332 RepID=A0ABU1TM81_9FLAO|nr:hypothetical protein [Flavobacterium arsenatis]MDR6966927.1 hypothetical protein [Flavobacterium arsenatis]
MIFQKKTTEILAKRVGFICSNQDCNRHTVGPNSEHYKATSIGIAAHIAAASPNGPRYDINQTEAERKHINNGIWLCANCSALIDKNIAEHTTELLLNWKKVAEQNMSDAIAGKNITTGKIVPDLPRPYLEAELIWSHKARVDNGYSSKNLIAFEQPIPAGTDLYVHWTLRWSFSIVIHNNSESPSYNLKLLQRDNKRKFIFLEELPKINNLQPFQSTDLEAKFDIYFHGTSEQADQALPNIPHHLIGLEIELHYVDNQRTENLTLLTITENGIESTKLK